MILKGAGPGIWNLRARESRAQEQSPRRGRRIKPSQLNHFAILKPDRHMAHHKNIAKSVKYNTFFYLQYTIDKNKYINKKVYNMNTSLTECNNAIVEAMPAVCFGVRIFAILQSIGSQKLKHCG